MDTIAPSAKTWCTAPTGPAPKIDAQYARDVMTKYYAAYSTSNDSKYDPKESANSRVTQMLKAYHPNVVFSDPVYGEKKGKEVALMLRKALENKTINITVEGDAKPVPDDSRTFSVPWRAQYTFGNLGKVDYLGTAHVTFDEQGRIVRHRDESNKWEWAKEAFGSLAKAIPGYFLSTFVANHKLKQWTRENGLADTFSCNEPPRPKP